LHLFNHKHSKWAKRTRSKTIKHKMLDNKILKRTLP